jgi:hypothetical protein
MALVFLKEMADLPRRIGGARGILTILLLAAAGSLAPWKLGSGLLDPVVLLAYSSFAILFTGSFVAQSFAGEKERAELENRGEEGPTDIEVAAGKTMAGTVFGIMAWALILGGAIAALATMSSRVLLPPLFRCVALLLFTACCAWFTACAGAVVSLNVFSAQSARQMLRLAFFFVLLAAISVPRLLPGAWQDALTRQLSGERFNFNLFVAAVLLAAVGMRFLRRAVVILGEKREPLSILG